MDEVTHGITREYLDDNRIVVFRATALNQFIARSWNAAIVNTIEQWPPDSTSYLTLYDLSYRGISMPFLILNTSKIYHLSVYATGRDSVEAAFAKHPNLLIRLALVFTDSMSGQITISRSVESSSLGDRFDYRVFFDEPTALAWLREFL